MAVIDVRTGSYFPNGLVLAGAIVAAFGLLFVFVNYMVGLPTLLIGLALSTTHYRLVIDTKNKIYKDCVWFFGFRNGSPAKFDNIEYLFIKISNESQTMYGRVARTTIRKQVFDGYLKFSETDKIHVATLDNKSDLIHRLQPIATALGVPINDYTTA